MHTFCLHSNKSRCLWGSFFPVCYMLALKFACTSDEVLHGVDCCRGRSGGEGGGVMGLCKRETRRFTVYTQTLAFSSAYSLFYLQNRINNYKQTTKSTVRVNYDYATIHNTAVFSFATTSPRNSRENYGTLLNRFTILLTCLVLLVTLSYTNSM